MVQYDSYVICTSPRSGSTLLCNLLAATGVAGIPQSYFHEPSVSDWAHDLNLPVDASRPEPEIVRTILRAAIAQGSRDNGIFGLRLQRHSFAYLVEKLAVLFPEASADAERFQAAFGRTLFIHLTRTDKVEQAVSLVKAQQTGLWHRAPDGTEIERLAPPRQAVYDSGELRAKFEEVTAYDRDWQQWLTTEAIEPLQMTYQALSADPKTEVRRVLSALGLDPAAANGIAPGVARLADSTNAQWVKRFRAELCGKQR